MRIWMVKSKSDNFVSYMVKILFPGIEKPLILGKRDTIIVKIELLMVFFRLYPKPYPIYPKSDGTRQQKISTIKSEKAL